MFHAYVQRFDVTENVKDFAKKFRTKLVHPKNQKLFNICIEH